MFEACAVLVQISGLSLSVAGFSTAQQQLQWLHLHQLTPLQPVAAVEGSNRRRSSRQQQKLQEGQEQQDAALSPGAAAAAEAAAATAAPNLAAHLVSRMPQLSRLRLMYNTIAQVRPAC
jgi:predicted membrane-bound mannosyltransferase